MNDPQPSQTPLQQSALYLRIYTVVRQIPRGRVATYGQIAAIVGDCTPRMVGYAMAATPPGSDVPWHRVINAQGKISLRADGGGAGEQRARLEAEGIHFDGEGRANLRRVQWPGPSMDWLLENGFDLGPLWREG
ncbi:MAG: MGMT family protein [Caldilineaceae bacterium]|nr:MGMT family protein [Caldilineaceae bacterium]